ncbi:type VII secretion protein EccB [Amycolatopsis arida]|uniref:Type VII secretion protein EccB n=1 Tax=Amycolatopsis arida TaxID=587909 RepID=A0A1I6A1U4_9PSEU|nr:type VII secretion protein EccB [Amycolatopsis arida]TDX88685.1 type VII secretion protein EccB [Amycolatopsis arida]SFQ62691.1 type VII secretion protein EccB [Amycolatopsis arida]
MPSTPTTKSQVQAYQFVLRRMQSALVRKDAVMLHDPMRTHSRATAVGVVLSVLGMLGFIIFGLFKPAPQAPGPGSIVIGEQSGSMYVVAGEPKKLIPTFNLASARLLLLAQQDQAAQGGAGGGQNAAPAGGQVEVVEPQVVPDDQLKDIPKGRLHGIPDAPGLLPKKEQRISDDWAVCDEIGLDHSLPDPTSINQNETTVFGGVQDLGQELAPDSALLVTADNGSTYLVYRQVDNPNRPNADTVRAKVDLTQASVVRALGLDVKPRHISMGLLNAIPEVTEIKAPVIEGANESSTFNLSGLRVGDVFSTVRAGAAEEYWVITRHGIQRVPRAVADLIRFHRTGQPAGITQVRPDRLQNVPVLHPGQPGYLPVDDYPQIVPHILDPVRYPVTCLGWSLVGEGANRDGQTKVYYGAELPGPKNEQGESVAVQVGQASPDGMKVDRFYMRPNFAAVVRSATSKETFDKGPIQLISDRGIRYGVKDLRTAQALGLGEQSPAPESIIRLLPAGASLNTQDVMRTFDSVPVDPRAGTFQPPQPQAAGN